VIELEGWEGECPNHPGRMAIGCHRCLPADYDRKKHRLELIAWARSLVGKTKFYHAGRDPNTGLDCSGLMVCGGWHMGWDIPAWKNYSRGIADAEMRKALETYFVPIETSAVLPGDILWIKVKRAAMHLALVTEQSGIIHVRWKSTVIEHGLDYRWHKRIAQAYRYRDLM